MIMIILIFICKSFTLSILCSIIYFNIETKVPVNDLYLLTKPLFISSWYKLIAAPTTFSSLSYNPLLILSS